MRTGFSHQGCDCFERRLLRPYAQPRRAAPCPAPELLGIAIGGTAITRPLRPPGDALGGKHRAYSQVRGSRGRVPGGGGGGAALDPERQDDRVGSGLPWPPTATSASPDWRSTFRVGGVPPANWLEPQLERPIVLAKDANCRGRGVVVGQTTIGVSVARSKQCQGPAPINRTGLRSRQWLKSPAASRLFCIDGNQGKHPQRVRVGSTARSQCPWLRPCHQGRPGRVPAGARGAVAADRAAPGERRPGGGSA